MALIVEDGSGIREADSYADLDFIRAYAAKRGVTLPANDDDCEVFVTLAMDFIETQCFIGTRKYPAGLSFPRVGIVLADGSELPDDEVPANIARALAQLTLYSFKGIDLAPSSASGPQVKREKVGPLETEFFEDTGASPSTPISDALLAPLLCGQVSGFLFRAVRV